MLPSGGQRTALSHRLRELRVRHWPDRLISQNDLAAAIGVSGPSVSSWESDQPKLPPTNRLASYAAFFATERSVQQVPYRLFSLRQLTSAERKHRDELLAELVELRATVTVMSHGLWHVPDGGDVTIVCARLPEYLTKGMPYANPDNPDYSDLYTYADPDALIELFGHIRAVNPTSKVTFQIASELGSDALKTHLVLLGGVDWNVVTRDVLQRFDMPVRQFRRDDDERVGGFEVVENGKRQEFLAKLAGSDSDDLIEDIAHFFRATSPYNAHRTITVCNGTYGRGTYGAVRALTDAEVRDSNESYVAARFASTAQFSILTRVIIMNGVPVTPEWNQADCRLHEWSSD
jgi:transcriptional regulator with XRE-family HTH domain